MKKTSIALCGTHGTGKTTIVDSVYGLILLETNTQITRINEVYQIINKSTNQNNGMVWQDCENITLATYHLQLALEKDKQQIIADRTPLDCFVYHNAEHTTDYFELAKIEAYRYCQSYDKIYLIEPSDRLITNDGFRNTSKDDQLAMHEKFLFAFKDMHNVVIVNQEKQEEIVNEICNFF
jgi:predicted ATPase